MQELLTNTKTAFKYKSTKDLKLAKWIYGIMHQYPDLVLSMSQLGMFAVEWKIPFADQIVYNTFYKVFVEEKTLKTVFRLLKILQNLALKLFWITELKPKIPKKNMKL